MHSCVYTVTYLLFSVWVQIVNGCHSVGRGGAKEILLSNYHAFYTYNHCLCLCNKKCLRDVKIYMFIFISECERLIRRMLQLEPAKRIPLSKVLEHRWMKSDLETTSPTVVCGSNEGIVWNADVLAAIQRMNYDVERCKQVCLVISVAVLT